MVGALLLLGGVLAASEGHPEGLKSVNVTVAYPQANCDDNKDCTTCAEMSTWTGSHCRWCALPNDNACHAEGSVYNKCSEKEQITDPISCPGSTSKLPHVQMSDDMQSRAKIRVLEAFAAYCPLEKIQNWTCKFCTMGTGGYTVTAVTQDKSLGAAGYVAYTTQPEKRIIISFRGSQEKDIESWVTDFKFIPKKVPWLPDPIEAHRGFLDAYLALRPALLTGLHAAQAACPDCNVSVTGHSLGAAEAIVCATDLATQGMLPQVFTFGCPRVGNAALTDWYRDNIHAKVGSFRAVHRNDIVPHVPTNDMGFHHMPREVWQTDENTYTMCDNSGEDHYCSWGVKVTDYSFSDHTRYFDIDEGCD